MTLDRFFSLPIPSEVAFCFFRGANEGLLVGGSVGRCRCCSVHSPWCWLRPRARGPAARPPRLLVAWPEDGNGGGGLGGRRETETDNAVVEVFVSRTFGRSAKVPHHQEGHESADHRLDQTGLFGTPPSRALGECLEEEEERQRGRGAAACLAATTTVSARPRGSSPADRQTLNVSALLSPRAFFSSISPCLARRDGMRQLRLLWLILCLFSLGVDCGDLGAVTVRESEDWRQRGVEGAPNLFPFPFPSHPSITRPASIAHRAPSVQCSDRCRSGFPRLLLAEPPSCRRQIGSRQLWSALEVKFAFARALWIFRFASFQTRLSTFSPPGGVQSSWSRFWADLPPLATPF